MIPVFAKKTEKYFQKLINNNDFNFIIKGNCEIGFMGGESTFLFDSQLDLTKINSSTYKTNTWLNQLK